MIRALLAGLLALGSPNLVAQSDAIRTIAEQSGYQRTGRYAEVAELCARFVIQYPTAVRCESFGTSPEGRQMQLMVVSRSGALTAAQARQQQIPVLLFQGGIHSGEIDGKDAGFLAIRQMLDGEAAPGALEKTVILFVPVFNVDGHERFGAWNRPNQRGPEEMGWRTTAQNYNLNRDYIKADAPEMQHMLRLLNRWDPIAFADLHATNGAQFEHDISIMVEPNHAGVSAMREAGRKLRDKVMDDLREQGSLPVPFYPSFVVHDDPTSGFRDSAGQPRFSLSYVGLRNRFSMLVETHSWKEYPVRVQITRNTIVSLTALTAVEGKNWLGLALAADREAAQLAGKAVPIAYAASDQSREIEFRGYAYTRSPSEVSGGLMTRYDESTPQVWRIPLRDDVVPSRSTKLPAHAYVVPAALAETIGDKLKLHDIRYEVVTDSHEEVPAFAYTATKVTPAQQSFEGRQMLTVEGTWAAQNTQISAGSLLIPVNGNNGYLLAAILDPDAPDSLLAWGFFNNHFEGKEYMEPYVAEAVARQMLADDPAIAAAFNNKLANDPKFAANPSARLNFFYRLHSSWDTRRNVYPVLRLDQPLQAKAKPDVGSGG